MSKQLWKTIQTHVGAAADGKPGDETARKIAAKLGLALSQPPVTSPATSPPARHGMKILGQSYATANAFGDYLAGLKFTAWKPSCVVIHHCAEPSLKQRPDGFIPQHMHNLKDFYDAKGWSAGPHLFIDDRAIWTFSPMTARGVHAVSFNATGIGIEMLGNYDDENPWTGRGLAVLTNTARATKLLLSRLGLDGNSIYFHRDDPKTSKTCPGKKIRKEQFIELVNNVKV